MLTRSRDPRCAAIAKRLATPLRVAVTGRRGVGRSTVARALACAGLAVTPPRGMADVDVYVLAEVVKPEDRAAIEAAGRPVLAVLNKADLIATDRTRSSPRRPDRRGQNPLRAAVRTLPGCPSSR